MFNFISLFILKAIFNKLITLNFMNNRRKKQLVFVLFIEIIGYKYGRNLCLLSDTKK